MERRTELLTKLVNFLVNLNLDETLRFTRECLNARIPAHQILTNGLSKGMERVGELFEKNEYFLSELLTAAYIMQESTKILEDKLTAEVDKIETAGTVVIGTVEGDLHDIGKNIVISMLRAAGFTVYDLGIDVPTKVFIQKVKELKPDFLGLSALLTTTLLKIKEVTDALKKEGLRDQVYVLIGGRPTNELVAKEFDADAYCKDAVEAVRVAKKYMSLKREQR